MFDGMTISGMERAALDRLPVAITIVDPDGMILYYNPKAAELVDRKPEYIGRDIRLCHQQKASVAKIDRVLAEFRSGLDVDMVYEAERNGRKFQVTFSPIRLDGELKGGVHTIVLQS